MFQGHKSTISDSDVTTYSSKETPHKPDSSQESFEEFIKQFDEKPVNEYEFSESTLSSIKQEAKKLKKKESLTHQEALDQIAMKKGFKSFNDCRKRHEYWQKLSPVYIVIPSYEKVYYTKSIENLRSGNDNSNSTEFPTDSHLQHNAPTEISRPNQPVKILDNHRFGLKLLNESEKEDFFNSLEDSNLTRSNREKDYIFMFIHYRFDPQERNKIRSKMEATNKKYDLPFREYELKEKLTELIDRQFHNALKLHYTTATTEIYEEHSIYPEAYLCDNEYYNAVDLYDAPFDQYGPISGLDY